MRVLSLFLALLLGAAGYPDEHLAAGRLRPVRQYRLELDAIASVVIGGTLLRGGVGNILGTLFGVLINGTIVSILQFDGTLTSWWTRIGVGVLRLIFIGVQSLFAASRSRQLS